MKMIMRTGTLKAVWRGKILAVQPRIRLTRSFDQRWHNYLGYVLTIEGQLGETADTFTIAVSEAAYAKHPLRAGDEVSGKSEPVLDERTETARFYKTSGLEVLGRADGDYPEPPPYLGVCPPLPEYRARGHRRLDARVYNVKCASCLWGCKMPVEMIIDHWNPSRKRYRTETWCYGPRSCELYRAGRKRVVPGRRGMSYTEEDWVDEEDMRGREDEE